jgi:hypothetical protein
MRRAIALFLGLALAGCSSSKGDKSPPPDQSAATPVKTAPAEPEPTEATVAAGPACGLSLEELRATLAIPDLALADTRGEGSVSTCEYKYKGSGKVTVRIEREANPEVFDDLRAGFGNETETIEDLGDRAFASKSGSGSLLLHNVMTIVGPTQVQVIAGGDRARVEAAARQILERL